MSIMKRKLLSRFFIVVMLIFLSACSYVQSLFPDKERDYQFTTEIPSLVLPTDLNRSANAAAAAPVPAKEPAVEVVADGAATAEVAPTTEPADAEPSVDQKTIQVELVKSEQGENRLRIGAPLAQSWRIVGKALSRKSMEVTQRLQAENSFVVQYNPNEEKVVDDSIWDELKFMFGGFEPGDKEYVVELQDIDEQVTEVLVTDKEKQSSADDGAGLKLLTLIKDTIKSDLAGK
ncbi:MAG: outer membrane protein assembly factor BamC [Methylococcaceae bacterium]|nr:outer membrane protein assembly factor BamC [Methylococcaceae bacterium]MDZ4156696.1 outer membrane protein assembly factor BamC [Methylococcales bacterium]MDP2394846.1 outer membrane protein assembly factor BamC [Methylococcaceae bacterium]MDP3020267.1 outer membrane protein assembly factor BamC [Methylococcaceae bacterium]MDP3390808.1 outer membrane protein assembly factor BamC [Methylococcaceae bacterium]